MKYRSTRNSDPDGAKFSFKDVLLAPGYAEDGGLYVPDHVPQVPPQEIPAWKELSYAQIAAKVLRLFVDQAELSDAELAEIMNGAYDRFDGDEVPLRELGKDGDLVVAELFNGPTLAFKDLSLSVLARLLDFFMRKEEGRVKILVGTSGDTGPAAGYSVAGLKQVDLVVLYPKSRVSRVQELQMTTIDADNVHIYAVDGTSDDLDVPIKNVFQDSEFSARHRVGSFNSLQWGRVLLQTAHYIYLFLKRWRRDAPTVTMVVPSGAAGNLAAGFLARSMGFDIRLVAAVNVNDFLVRCLRHGTMSTGQAVTPTLAPAMDIQAPYNVERLLFLATDGDAAAVRSMMTQLEERGRASLPAAVVEALRRVVVDTHCVDDGRIVDVMRRCQRDYGYTVCPHSATALAYHFHVCDRARQEGAATPAPPAVLLLTASAAKFPEACAAAGVPTPGHRFLDALVGRPNRVRGTFAAGHDWTQLLKKVIERL